MPTWGISAPALQAGGQAEGLLKATTPGWERSAERGDWWTWLPCPPAVLCATPGGFQRGAESQSWEPEVGDGSARGVRVGQGLLLGAHDHVQASAGPETTDVRVTRDTRIFPSSRLHPSVSSSNSPSLPGWVRMMRTS